MSFKDWSDIVGSLAQVFIVILGGFIFIQIKIAKNDLQIRCKRESLQASMDLAEKFAKEVVPAMGDYYTKIKNKGFNLEPVFLENFYSDEVANFKANEKKIYDEDVKFFQANIDLYADAVTIANLLEYLAMNFVKGVADEDVVFSAFYQTYCKFIEKNFAIFCILRHKDKYNFYENTIDLYKIWSSRAKAQGLSIQQKSIMLQLESINGGKKLTPIGTK